MEHSKMLSTREALELYKLLAPYLPVLDDDETGLGFIKKIIHSIKDAKDYDAYTDAIAVMIKVPVEKVLLNSTPEEAITLFGEGLISNKIFDLMRFVESLGWQTQKKKSELDM